MFWIVYLNAESPRELLVPFIVKVYGSEPDDYAVSGFLNFFSPLTFYTIAHYMIFPALINPYIFITRRTVMATLSKRAKTMSSKTRETHQSLIMVLSIHAVLPGCTLLGFILLFFQMTNFYHSTVVERLTYFIPVFPSIINPILTLFFIKPYIIAMLRFVLWKISTVATELPKQMPT